MAVKISGVDLSANTAANIGQAGSSGELILFISYISSSTAFVQLGVGDSSATFANAQKLLENTQIAPDESLSFSPVVAGASDYVIGRSTVASVNMSDDGV